MEKAALRGRAGRGRAHQRGHPDLARVAAARGERRGRVRPPAGPRWWWPRAGGAPGRPPPYEAGMPRRSPSRGARPRQPSSSGPPAPPPRGRRRGAPNRAHREVRATGSGIDARRLQGRASRSSAAGAHDPPPSARRDARARPGRPSRPGVPPSPRARSSRAPPRRATRARGGAVARTAGWAGCRRPRLEQNHRGQCPASFAPSGAIAEDGVQVLGAGCEPCSSRRTATSPRPADPPDWPRPRRARRSPEVRTRMVCPVRCGSRAVARRGFRAEPSRRPRVARSQAPRTAPQPRATASCAL
jgi:hypothetical protein